MRRILMLLAAFMVAVTTAHADGFKLAAPMKIAFIYVNAKDDGGWQQTIDEARQRMESALGTKIAFAENVPDDTGKIVPIVERYIQRGSNVILGSSFGYSDAFAQLAAKYPNVAFLDISGTKQAANLGSVYGRTYESQYLCGMAAAATSKTGKLGFVAPHPLGLVNWTINAYAMGARAVNPKATVTAVFTGSWFDPVKERAAASALIDQGIDVLGQNIDTPATQIVAQERGVHSTGNNRDFRELTPKSTVCSAVWVWDRYLVPQMKAIADGTWKPSPYGDFPGISGGGTEIACCGDAVPKEAVEKINAERQAIIDGKKIFAGPLKDRDGVERVAAGASLGDADLWKMDWYVDGVITQK